MKKHMFTDLIDKYLNSTASNTERRLVELYYKKMEGKMQTELGTEQEEEVRQRILRNIQVGIHAEAPVIPIYKRTWFRITAAASIFVIMASGVYLILNHKHDTSIATNQPQEKRFKNDVASPVNTKATITLSDGRTVALDSVANGTLATQGNVNVVKTADGKIIYDALRQAQGDIQYNTLTNPRGSKVVDMTLADGSRVWLNAGSSVTYPVAFVGKERNVDMTGEGYFEIAKNENMPFHVSVNSMQVEVLGTHFNVNSYSDESDIKVTLLEGSVKVIKGNSSGLLRPGQQAKIGSDVKIENSVDLDEVMAWKNGKFQFNNASIEAIMKQVARWYNTEVVYEGNIPGHFVADISRDVPVSKLLHIIELTNRVHFVIEGNRIVVRP